MNAAKVTRTAVAALLSASIVGGAIYYGIKSQRVPVADKAAEVAKVADKPIEVAKVDDKKPEVKVPAVIPPMPVITPKPEVKPVPMPETIPPPKPVPVPVPETKPVPVPETKPVPVAVKPVVAGKSDHVMFGGTPDRNFVNLVDKGIPSTLYDVKEQVADPKDPSKKIDKVTRVSDAKPLWQAELGSRAYGGPTIAGGKVFVGTNNEKPRNKRDQKKNEDGELEPMDKGVLMCFNEKTGELLWQAIHDKLPSGPVQDWPREGICSTPAVDGNRVYYVSNRCTIVCADVDGFANGNDGIQTEKYKDKTDVDIVWEFDMIAKLNVFPHNMSAGSPLVVGDMIFITTANGVDENHANIPSPEAPSFIALNKKDGTLAWKSSLPGKNIMHGQWSNPVYSEIAGVKQTIFTGGDGWLYSFEPMKGELLWKFDANPKDAIYELGGSGTRSDFVGTPIVYDGKVYIGVGQDPEHFTGIGHFWCINPAGAIGDISEELVDKTEKDKEGKLRMTGKPNPKSGVVWHYGGADKRKFVPRDFVFGRTMSTACIVDGVLYISELQGYVHCLDAKTGKKFWQYDLKGAIWGSAYYVDGKIFVGTDTGNLFSFKHNKTPKVIDEIDIADAKDEKDFRTKMLAKRKDFEKENLIAKVEFEAPVKSTPVVANGVIYVMTEKTLYAFSAK